MLVYQDSLISLYNNDCISQLSQLEAESVDLIITSPPYNLGNNHHTNKKRHNPYNDNMEESEYQNWQISFLNNCFRVLKESGSILYNHKNRIKNGVQISPYEWLFKTPFIIKQELVWQNGSPNFDKIRFYPMTERIYWLAKSAKTKLKNTISHNDVFNWSPVGTNKKHTRAFPEKMVEDLISCFPDCKNVLDPFCGSGTVLSVCKKLNKNCIGIELSQEYCELTIERLI